MCGFVLCVWCVFVCVGFVMCGCVCVCVCGFCNVWVCVCVVVCMCGCSGVLVFTVFCTLCTEFFIV